MRIRAASLFALAVLVLSVAATPAPAQMLVSPQLDEISRSLEAKLRSNIERAFGAESKILVSVQATPAVRVPPAASKTNDVDVGYLPIPVNPEADSAAGGPSRNVAVEAFYVDIQAPADTPDTVLEEAKKIATNTLRG